MMRTPRLLCVLALSAVLVPVLPATAVSDNLGTTGTPTMSCSANQAQWSTSGADVVATAGLLTRLTLHSTSAGGEAALKLIRGTTVVATTPDRPVPADGQLTFTGLSIQAQVGDQLGIWAKAQTYCGVSGGTGTYRFTDVNVPDPPVGTVLTPVGSTLSSFDFTISGLIEADADHDGFGDATQDACPADASRHVGPCTGDLVVSTTALSSTIGVGDVSVLQTTVRNPSTGNDSDVRLVVTPSAGLQLVASSPACAGSTCSLGTLPAGGSATLLLVVKGVGAGPQSVSVTGSESESEGTPTDNTAVTAVTVEQRAKVECVVPKVTGQTTAVAKLLLAARGCAAGTIKHIKKGHAKRGTVSAQARPTGTHLPTGTRVGLTVRS